MIFDRITGSNPINKASHPENPVNPVILSKRLDFFYLFCEEWAS
jgi:hypothetical protein